MESPYAIEMLNITKRFPGIIANDNITLQLKKGEIHAQLGENGAGKSTLMSVLFGLYQPEEGIIKKDGQVVSIKDPNDANALGIGMVHQHFKLVECFSVLDNIIMGVEPTKCGFLHKKDARAKVIALSEKYGLKIDPGTPLWQQRQSTDIPDDDTQADMYLWTVDYLKKHGYEQYEISNFAQPGYESRHNLKHWTLGEYAGFGPGAHSDFGGVRYAYVRDLDGYIGGRLILSESESDATLTRDYEYVMLSLRTAEGIDSRYFETTYRQRFQPMEELFLQYERAGLACRTENGRRLTPRGFLVSNSIIVALEDALAQQKLRREQAVASGNYRVI